jgi:2-methylcitrate dehydratase
MARAMHKLTARAAGTSAEPGRHSDGGGLYGSDREKITTKEQADHSLPYLLAVALLDGTVMPAQFAPDRINRADVQQLLGKVVVRPDHDYTRQYPGHMPAKITVRLSDGTVRTHTVQGFPGLPSHPFTWQDAVDNFDQLVDGLLDHSLSDEIKHAVQSLETIQTRDLTKLLAAVPYPA